MELRRCSRYDGFESNFEKDIKRVFQIDQFTDEVQSNFGKLAIKSKAGLKICLRHRIFGALPILCITGFKDEENEQVYTRQKIYIAISSEHFLNQSVKVLPQISGLRIWCSSSKFDHEMNSKGLLQLVPLERRVK